MHIRRLILLMVVAIAATTLTTPNGTTATGASTRYRVTDLGTLGGSFSGPLSVNNRGDVAGVSAFAGDTALRGFIWHNGQMTDLGDLGGPQTAGTQVNASGQVAGWSDLNIPANPSIFNQKEFFCNPPMVSGAPAVVCRAFLWQHGRMTDLGTLGGPNSAAENQGLNNRGQVVGVAETATVDPTSATGGLEFHAFRWQHGRMTDLGTLSGAPDSVAAAINDRGQVVGVSINNVGTFEGKGQGFIWQDGKMTDLGTLGGTTGTPHAINNRGQVVGGSALPGDATLHAFLWQDGRMTDLGTLPGDVSSEAFGITDHGQVFGVSCSNSQCRAAMWDAGTVTDLGTLISAASGWQLFDAQAGNARGQIVGDGLHNGMFRAFLLTPVHEGESR